MRKASKELLREELLEKRRELAFEEVFSLSRRVQENFLGTGYYTSAGRIALYASFNNEVLTDLILEKAASSGKEVYYPRVVRSRRRLAFHRVTKKAELQVGSYKILEPVPGEEMDPGAFDLVVVPGVAFDRSGGRIGYGKGYYDSALRGVKAAIVALAYGFQVVGGRIPVEDHDVRVRAIVTEKGVIEAAAR